MFHLFASEWGDGEGGMDDYKGSFDTVDAAKEACTPETGYVWAQIVVMVDGSLRVHSTGKPTTEERPHGLSNADYEHKIIAQAGTLGFHVFKIILGYEWTENEDTLA